MLSSLNLKSLTLISLNMLTTRHVRQLLIPTILPTRAFKNSSNFSKNWCILGISNQTPTKLKTPSFGTLMEAARYFGATNFTKLSTLFPTSSKPWTLSASMLIYFPWSMDAHPKLYYPSTKPLFGPSGPITSYNDHFFYLSLWKCNFSEMLLPILPPPSKNLLRQHKTNHYIHIKIVSESFCTILPSDSSISKPSLSRSLGLHIEARRNVDIPQLSSSSVYTPIILRSSRHPSAHHRMNSQLMDNVLS